MGHPPVPIRVVRLPHGQDIPLPAYGTEHSAGMDIRAAVQDALTIAPGARTVVPSGLAIEIPPGFEGQVRPRSGLAAQKGITLINSPGTIDADYRGELLVLVINHGSEPVVVERGDRIGQLVVSPVARAVWVEAKALTPTRRGRGGLGHTGTR